LESSYGCTDGAVGRTLIAGIIQISVGWVGCQKGVLMRRLPILLLLFVVLVVLASCGGDSSVADVSATTTVAPSTTVEASTTTLTPTTTAGEVPRAVDGSLLLDWGLCGPASDYPSMIHGNEECALLTVPLDHDDPDVGTIDLALVRRRAKVPEERIGVLLYNPGGPAASGTNLMLFEWWSDVFSRDLIERFDIVSWDPRGVISNEVLCIENLFMLGSSDPTPETVEEAEQIEEQHREFVDACVEHSGHLLPHLSTVSTARDMDLIREALGEEQISYLGQSYGAGLGAVYATLFPDRTRAAVLDGAYTFTETGGVSEVSAADKALQEALEQCAADIECPFHSGGDPFSAFDDLMESLDATPLMVNDSELMEDDFEVGLADALFAVRMDLYREERWPDVMQTLADARNGDGSRMTGLRWMVAYDPSMTAQAMHCLDYPRQPLVQAETRVVPLPADTPRLARLQGHRFDLCSLWPVEPDLPPPLTAAGAGPILLIGTTGDVATTLAMARELADELDDGVLLIVERNAHTGYQPQHLGGPVADTQCVTSTVDNYLINLEPPVSGSVCTHGDPTLKPPE
jgi:pimeloyl-ACP methyl ester carboxylesterase